MTDPAAAIRDKEFADFIRQMLRDQLYYESAEWFDALLARLERYKQQEECDCVEFVLSSFSCPKCGKPASIPHERWVEIVALAGRAETAEARLERAEAVKQAARELVAVLDAEDDPRWDGDNAYSRLSAALREQAVDTDAEGPNSGQDHWLGEQA